MLSLKRSRQVPFGVPARFLFYASSTIHKGQRYFRRVLVDDPVSRINFCTIPERPIGAEMPVFGRYDAEDDDRLRPYIRCLTEACGPVECRQARLLARRLVEEKAEEARLSQNRVFGNLSFRANVIAFLKASCSTWLTDRSGAKRWRSSSDGA